ncbi:MAG: N-acetyltransferase family protein [Sphingobium sp.]
MAGPLILRAARPADAAAIAAIYAPYVRDTAISFESDPPDAAAMADRIAAGLARQWPWIVALAGSADDARDGVAERSANRADGAVLGYAYAGPFHSRHAYRFMAEPSIYLAPTAHRRGVGKHLYDRLLTILTELGYRQATALIALPNPASVALHERCGFIATGTLQQSGLKFGQWVDVGLFQRPLGMGGDTPPQADPLPLSDSAGWMALQGRDSHDASG